MIIETSHMASGLKALRWASKQFDALTNQSVHLIKSCKFYSQGKVVPISPLSNAWSVDHLHYREVLKQLYEAEPKGATTYIATQFVENPIDYDEDWAHKLKPAIEFHRLCSPSVVSENDKLKIEEKLKRYTNIKKLVIHPANKPITKISGLYCKSKDKSYFALLSLEKAALSGEGFTTTGLLQTGGFAKYMFEYYYGFLEDK